MFLQRLVALRCPRGIRLGHGRPRQCQPDPQTPSGALAACIPNLGSEHDVTSLRIVDKIGHPGQYRHNNARWRTMEKRHGKYELDSERSQWIDTGPEYHSTGTRRMLHCKLRRLVGLFLTGALTLLASPLQAGDFMVRAFTPQQLDQPPLAQQLARIAPHANPGVLHLAAGPELRRSRRRPPGGDRFLAALHRTQLWVFDLRRDQLMFRELVSHGQGSGDNMATAFSNIPRATSPA